jgi:hypothetical protein
MISKNYGDIAVNTSTWTEVILEIKNSTPNAYYPNAFIKYQPATVDMKVTGANDVMVIVEETPADPMSTFGEAQGGYRMEATNRYTWDFNMGAYKVRFKSLVGASTVRLQGLYFVRSETKEI